MVDKISTPEAEKEIKTIVKRVCQWCNANDA
jgi:phage host-nuclease inhibitor protein Gam